MPTKSTPSQSTPSSVITGQHSQYIRPNLNASSVTLIGENGTFTAFLPKSARQEIASRADGRPTNEMITEQIVFGFDNAEVVVPSNDFPVDPVTVMVKISSTTHSRASALAKLYFQENLGLALGWLASVSVNPKRWGVRPEKTKIKLPWSLKPKSSSTSKFISSHLTSSQDVLELRHLPPEWPAPKDIEQVRLATGLSSAAASRVLGMSRSSARAYETGVRGMRIQRYRAFILYIEWIKKNAPHRLGDLDETTRRLANDEKVMKPNQELMGNSKTQAPPSSLAQHRGATTTKTS